MRINRLVIEGFGPFRERQELDFDRVAGAGLFLIGGDTGSGKSTILDAISYALFGAVPRYFGDVKRIRSDFCALGEPTQVVLEFTTAAGTYRVTRSPEYDRPKQRSKSGATTTQKPYAEFAHRDRAEWVVTATKEKEVALAIGQVLQLNQQQFQQVILLAQGKFMAFLQARSQDRREVLSTIFETARFDNLRELLHDQEVAQERVISGRLMQIGERASQAVDLLAPIQQFFSQSPVVAVSDNTEATAGGGVGVGGEPEAVESVATSWIGAVAPDPVTIEWVAKFSEAVTGARPIIQNQISVAQSSADEAAKALVSGKEIASIQQRRDQAESRHRELLAENEKQFLRQETYKRGQNLVELRKLVQAYERAESATDKLRQKLMAGQLILGVEGDFELPPSVAQISAALATRQKMVGELAEVKRLEKERQQRAESIVAAEAELETCRSESEQLTEQLSQLPLLQAELAQHIVRADEARHTVSAISNQLTEVQKLRQAAVTAANLSPQRVAAEIAVSTSLQEYEKARNMQVQTLARIRDETAAALAGTLVAGEPCPVCGGLEHPNPALSEVAASSDELTARLEELSEQVEQAEIAHDLCVDELFRINQELAVAAALSQNRELPQLEEEIAVLTGQLAEAQLLISESDQFQNKAEALSVQAERLQTRLLELTQEIGQKQARYDEKVQQSADIESMIVAESGEFTTVQERVASIEDELDRLTQLAQISQQYREAQVLVEETLRVMTEASATFGIELPAEIEAPSAEALAELASEIDQYREELAVVTAILRTREIQEVSRVPVDVAALAAKADSSKVQAEAVVTSHMRLIERLDQGLKQLENCRGLLVEAKTETDCYTRLRELAETLSGRGSGTKNMDLETFVLAAKLEEIVAAANIRLTIMSDGRFELIHDPSPESHRAKSGLGLAVVDNHTGKPRSPESLSGGETFVASLALALGLADVVSQQSGGIHLDTLFVDEGFGSLDPNTLDTALTALENLRTNGRMVGLISHVAAMKERIPAAIDVFRLPTLDSRVCLVTDTR